MKPLLAQVVGHEKNMSSLSAALKQQRLAQTLLFAGPEGVGKSRVALGLAQALICGEAELACGSCPSCQRVANQQSEALLILKPQNNQLKMDQARELIQFFNLQKVGQARVAIVDQAELMNVQAANALLKTLEEPPQHSYIILLASSATAVLSTIRSRSQVQRFAPLSREQLQQVVDAEPWMIEAAQGRASRVEQLSGENMQEVRSEAFALWQQLLENRPIEQILDRNKELVKDKSQSLLLARLWMQLLRDSRYAQDQLSPLIHQDFLPLIQQLAQVSPPVIDDLAKGCLKLERDVLAHLDRSLSFESYLRHARGQLHG